MAKKTDDQQEPSVSEAEATDAQQTDGDSNNAAELVHLRNDFYRDSYRSMMTTLLLAAAGICGLIILLVYIVLTPPQPKYFAVDQNGRITPLVALDKPNLSPAALLQWATQAAIASYTYNFVNYKQELQAASEFFTPSGWRQFVNAVQSSNNIEAIVQKKLVVSAVAKGAPTIVWSGHLADGRYAWRIQLPLLVTYQSASQLNQQSIVVDMRIARVSTLFSARGIGIEQFVAQ